MPQFRQDPVSGQWVIIAGNRSKRPYEFRTADARIESTVCPFCEGNEDQTPHEVFAYRDPPTNKNGPGWHVRIVPNKFPALDFDYERPVPFDELYSVQPAHGIHDIIIESTQHVRSLTELRQKEVKDLFFAYRDRMREVKRDKRIVYGLIFKNVGASAGASLEHSHSQLMATPITPHRVQAEWNSSQEFFIQRNECIFCEIMHREQTLQQRTVMETDHFFAYCPFASRFPHEMCILPKSHQSHFEDANDNVISDLAQIMHNLISRLETVVEGCAYNYLFHTSPFDKDRVTYYHWHVEILPRTTNTAGFEWGTGFNVNPVPPEESALHLSQCGGQKMASRFPTGKTR